MDNPHIMQMLDSQNKLPNYLGCNVLLDCAMFPYILKQIFSLHELGDDVEMSFCLNTFLIKDEKGMIQNAHYAAFMSTLDKDLRY